MNLKIGLATIAFSVFASCVARDFHSVAPSKASDSATTEGTFTTWYNTLPTGPIANYELTANIVFHKVGSELLPDFLSKSISETQLQNRVSLTSAGSDRGSRDGGVSMVWMRDYQPIVIKSDDPQAGGKARFVGYFSISQARNAYTGAGIPIQTPGILNSLLFSVDHAVLGSQNDTVSFLKMPLLLEGGNVVASGDYVFTTDHIFLQNSPDYSKFLSRKGGTVTQNDLQRMYTNNGFFTPNSYGEKFEYRTPEQVKQTLSRYLEIPIANIITLPALPGEGTKHIDLYVLAVGPNHLMIPEITDEGISKLAFENEKILARRDRDFLNEQAQRIRTDLNFTVDRLPMLPPVYQFELAGETQGVFFSPANSLLANMGPGRKFVFLPHFEVPANWGSNFRDYSNAVEKTWSEYFASQGWTPQFVTANNAARAYGLIRCLTAQVPFISERHMKRFTELKY